MNGKNRLSGVGIDWSGRRDDYRVRIDGVGASYRGANGPLHIGCRHRGHDVGGIQAHGDDRAGDMAEHQQAVFLDVFGREGSAIVDVGADRCLFFDAPLIGRELSVALIRAIPGPDHRFCPAKGIRRRGGAFIFFKIAGPILIRIASAQECHHVIPTVRGRKLLFLPGIRHSVVIEITRGNQAGGHLAALLVE